jgi:hypothetical protein
MKYIFSIILLGLGLAGLFSGTIFRSFSSEIFLGMLGPMFISIISIILYKNTYAKSPDLLTSILVKSFIFKMIFFAVYLIIIFSFYNFESTPFIISFTGFFITFYVFLQKLIQPKND